LKRLSDIIKSFVRSITATPRLDVTQLEQAVSVFRPPRSPIVPTAATCAEPPALLRGLAIDGKAIRGVGRAGQPGQLVSLVPHSAATVLGQVEIARKRAARSAVPAVLADRDLTGTVITFDALPARRTTARALRSQHGHDLLRVQKNQAAWYAYVELRVRLPAHPAAHEGWERVGRFSEQGHGRWDTRRLIYGNAHIEAVDWLAVPQVVRRAWERIALKRGNR
jgi:hypothetical protein